MEHLSISDFTICRGHTTIGGEAPPNPTSSIDVDQKEKPEESPRSLTDRRGLEDSADKEISVDGEEPTADEKKKLRHVPENLPLSAWFVAVVELCERFTYYGCQVCTCDYKSQVL